MSRKQILLLENKKMFLPGVKNIFASRTQILRPKHMFPSLATMKTMLISFQCRSLSKNCFVGKVSVLTTIKMADCEEIEAGQAQKKGKGRERMPIGPLSSLLLSQSLSGSFFRIPSSSSSKQAIIIHKIAIVLAFCRLNAMFLINTFSCTACSPGDEKM